MNADLMKSINDNLLTDSICNGPSEQEVNLQNRVKELQDLNMKLFLDHEKQCDQLQKQNDDLKAQFDTLEQEYQQNQKLLLMEIESLKEEATNKITYLKSQVDELNMQNITQVQTI